MLTRDHLGLCLEGLDLAYRHIGAQIQQAGIAAAGEGRAKLKTIEDAHAAVSAEIASLAAQKKDDAP